jgi:hypothetical protein
VNDLFFPGFADMLERISPWGVRHQRIDDGDITRYELADGSAIIESRGCWDVEHLEFRFMMECANPDEDTVRHHAEMLDSAGYDAEPAEIDVNFVSELTPEELLFRRIFDVAVAQEPDENSPLVTCEPGLRNRATLSRALHRRPVPWQTKGYLSVRMGPFGHGDLLFTTKRVMTRRGK